jgi:hypothetical protein
MNHWIVCHLSFFNLMVITLQISLVMCTQNQELHRILHKVAYLPYNIDNHCQAHASFPINKAPQFHPKSPNQSPKWSFSKTTTFMIHGIQFLSISISFAKVWKGPSKCSLIHWQKWCIFLWRLLK